jgi:hypothetical protein
VISGQILLPLQDLASLPGNRLEKLAGDRAGQHSIRLNVNEICRGKRGISAEMAVKLSLALGASPQFWLNLQKNWELSQVNIKAVGRIKPIAA